MVIFYFSGTGNTWWTSLELKKELENLGNTIEMYSIENPLLKEENFVPDTIEKADHVIIGYPIYGSALPKNVRDFIRNLPKVSDSTKFGAFCTQAGFSGDGNWYFKKDAEAKGYKFQQSFQINFTTNFNVAIFPFSLSKPAEGVKLKRKKIKVAKKIKRMAKKIVNNERYIEGRKFYQMLLGRLQRSLFLSREVKFSKGFKFSKDRCTKCKLCVQTCPTKSLKLDESKDLNLIRNDNCILCFRCYNFCPTLAINFGKNIKDPTKYKRFTGPVKDLKISDIRK